MSTPPGSDRWLLEGEEQLLWQVRASDADLSSPSLLPGWTRAYVLAHLIGNAQGINNLVTWAATGRPTSMYPSMDARAAQIEDYATRPADWLHSHLAESSAQLTSAYAALTPKQRQTVVKTARGEERPADYIAWMRAREAAIHLIDLDIEYTFADLPPDLLDAIFAERLASLADAADLAIELRPSDRSASFRIGTADSPATVIDDVTLADLTAWLTGRTTAIAHSRTDWPELPPWL
jgi:maleylpyruvate isomerase